MDDINTCFSLMGYKSRKLGSGAREDQPLDVRKRKCVLTAQMQKSDQFVVSQFSQFVALFLSLLDNQSWFYNDHVCQTFSSIFTEHLKSQTWCSNIDHPTLFYVNLRFQWSSAAWQVRRMEAVKVAFPLYHLKFHGGLVLFYKVNRFR